MNRSFASMLLASVMACGGAPPVASAPEPGGAATDPPAPTTGYRAGDYVVYRYSGSYSEHPVTLKEVVDRVEGNRLWIRVSANRGDEHREWIQVVTDTPHNRDNNMVDELFEVRGGQEFRLSNDGNADIFRLYSWTIPPCEGTLDVVARERQAVKLSGDPLECDCILAKQTCSGQPARMSACDCPDFLWTHANATLRAADTDEVLWAVEVVEHGPREPQAP